MVYWLLAGMCVMVGFALFGCIGCWLWLLSCGLGVCDLLILGLLACFG